jgi:GT2 family glycosyltransferase
MVDVIVVNWNAGEQLRECVESILLHARAEVSRIIVIDNGSVDGSERLIEGLPSVLLVRAGRNLGFGKACNLGFSRSSADFILLLNPDARLEPGSLQTATEFLMSPRRARAGIVGLQNVSDGGVIQRSCARFPSAWSFVRSSFGLSTLWPRRFPDMFMREWAHNEDREVDHVIGSCALVRRAAWQRLNGMDERFFVYLEDLDFSLRAREQGWTTWFLASSHVYHKGGGTSDQVKATRLFYSLRSRLLYAAKHFGTARTALVAATTLLVEPFTRVAGALLRGDWTTARETMSGYRSLYLDAPNIARALIPGRPAPAVPAGVARPRPIEGLAPSRMPLRSRLSEATGLMRRTSHHP